jgi:hypothetical protein
MKLYSGIALARREIIFWCPVLFGPIMLEPFNPPYAINFGSALNFSWKLPMHDDMPTSVAMFINASLNGISQWGGREDLGNF